MDFKSRPLIILRHLICILALGIISLSSNSAYAASSNWVETNQTKVRLISDSTSIGDRKKFWLGLQFQMKPAWKIYWRSPGDAGFPPEVKWDGSRNLQGAEIQWPVPLRFSVQGLETLGYKNQVVLPILASTITSSETAYLNANIRFLACNNICIPHLADLNLKLPKGEIRPSKHAHLIAEFRARVPKDGLQHGLKINALHSVEDSIGPRLQLIASADPGFSNPDVFVEGPRGLAYGKPTITMLDGAHRALINITVEGRNSLDDKKGPTLNNRTFTVTLADGVRAVEKSLVAQPGSPELYSYASSPKDNEITLAAIILLAIIGGLILNLMPCVLPVLSLKVLGLIQHGGGNSKTIRASFMASAAGIISAFLVLASALASLKAAGMAVGWGIQFQQPWFLICLTLLITIFTCNLWGFFDFRLPQFIPVASVRSTSINGFSGHFLQGAFATLLATPSSAPFVGTAVGFALAGSTGDLFLVFGALGLGLALPYLLFAAFPRVASRLPKPGPWMVKLKFAMGFALAATGIWLLTILFNTSGPTAVWICGGLMVTIGLVLIKAHQKSNIGLKLSAPVVLVAIFIAVIMSEWLTPSIKTREEVNRGYWEDFDEMAIAKMVQEGKTIYVDVTADWCITCFTNKTIVFNDKRVIQLISSGKVFAMRADWTKPNNTISRYLARYNRYGIPFNIVYGPKEPQGIVLPELLTAGIVLDAFGLAAGDKYFATKK